MPAKGVLVTVTADVVVAGGGVIGTAIAWRAAAAGLDVVLADPAAGDAASLVAAGMLAPVSEALFGEGALLRVNLLGLARARPPGGLAPRGPRGRRLRRGRLRRSDAADGVPPLRRTRRGGTRQPGLPQ